MSDPLQSRATTAEQVKAIVAFSARYFSGGPFQDPVRVLLKVRMEHRPWKVEIIPADTSLGTVLARRNE